MFFICVCNSFLSIFSQKNSYHFHSNKDNLLVDSTGNNITETTHTLIFLPLDFYHASYKIKIGAFIKFWNSLQNNENEILPGFLQWYRMCNWKNFNWNSDCFFVLVGLVYSVFGVKMCWFLMGQLSWSVVISSWHKTVFGKLKLTCLKYLTL